MGHRDTLNGGTHRGIPGPTTGDTDPRGTQGRFQRPDHPQSGQTAPPPTASTNENGRSIRSRTGWLFRTLLEPSLFAVDRLRPRPVGKGGPSPGGRRVARASFGPLRQVCRPTEGQREQAFQLLVLAPRADMRLQVTETGGAWRTC